MPRAGRLPGPDARTAMRAAGPLAAPARGWARWDPGTAGRPGFRLPGASGLRPQAGRLGGAGGAKRPVRVSASLGGGGGGSGGGRSGGGGGDGPSSSGEPLTRAPHLPLFYQYKATDSCFDCTGPDDHALAGLMLLLVLGTVCPPSARAKAKHKAKEEQAADVYAKRLADLYWPVLHNLGFSGVVGWITAFFLKVMLDLRFAN